MVEIADIKDLGSLEEWLNTFSDDEEVRRAAVVDIAVRAALRVLPAAWGWFSRQSDLTAMPVLRSSLIASVARNSPTEAIRKAAAAADADAAAFAAAADADAAAPAPFAAAADADAAAAFAAADAAFAAAAAPFAAAADADAAAAFAAADAPFAAAATDIWSDIQTDCRIIVEGQALDAISLWGGDNPLAKVWSIVRSAHSPRPYGSGKYGEGSFGTVPNGPWAFWIDWYEKVLTGAPQDWDLLEAIVDQVDWDGAPEEVNRQIQQIERDHLRATIRRLKEETAKVLAVEDDLPSRGHNHPPELIKDDADAKAAITFIWADLDDAEKELEKDQPDPSALKRLGDALKTGAWKVLKYLGEKADLAVDGVVKEGAKSSSKWLIRALGVGYIAQLEAIQSAGSALLEFAQRLFQAGGMV